MEIQNNNISKNKKKGFRLRYNSPVVLSFALFCTALMIIDQLTGGKWFMYNLFMVPGNTMHFNLFSLDIIKLVSHAAGHGNWLHLISNFSFILLLGPILEERYGSGLMILMMLITAFVTGVLNIFLFPNPLLGASGIVFMLILLISFTNVREGEIPITFVIVVLLYIGQEVYRAFFQAENNISEFAHIIGGICGGLFGFLLGAKKQAGKSVEEVIS